jgi:TetR/AcrR family hemagglutinin/protease transcriptional regulator
VLFETIWRFALSVESEPNLVRVWLDWSTGIRGDMWSLYLAVQDRIISDLREVVQRGQREGSVDESLDPGDAARIIVGEGHHVALMMFAGVDRERVRRFLAHLIESALLLGRTRVL